MAVLYNKAYRRGGARRGGFLKASPDPVSYADLPNYAFATLTDSEPAYLAEQADDWFPTQTIKKITKQEAPFPTTAGGGAIGHNYSRMAVQSGDYVWLTSREPGYVLRSDDFTYVHNSSYSNQYVAYVSRRYPGRLWGKSDGNAGNNFGYYPTLANTSGFVSVYNPDATYSRLWTDTSGEWALDYNEEYAAFCAQKVSDSTWDLICVRISDGTVVGTLGASEASPVNTVTMAPSGNYIVAYIPNAVTWNGTTGPRHNVYDRDFNLIRSINTGTAHNDIGFLEDGVTDVHCYISSSTNELRYTVLSTGTDVKVLDGPSGGVDLWRFNHHLSMRCLERPGYCYVSTFDYNMTSFTSYKGANVVLAVRLATGEIEPWCTTQHSESDDWTYAYQPHVTTDFTGKRVYFKSSWRRTAAANAGTTAALGYVAWRPR